MSVDHTSILVALMLLERTSDGLHEHSVTNRKQDRKMSFIWFLSSGNEVYMLFV